MGDTAELTKKFLEAAAANSVKEMEALLRRGADVECTNADQWTAAHLAAREGAVDALEFVLEIAPDLINAQSIYGSTPLHRSARWSQGAAIALLLSHGADESIKDCSGRTARDVAHQFGEAAYAEAVKTAVAGARRSGTSSPSAASRGRKRQRADEEPARTEVLRIADSDSGNAPATGASAATAGAPHGTVARSTAPLRAPAETGLIAALRLDGFVHVARAYVPGVGWQDAYIPGDTARDTKPPQSPAGAATAVGGGAEAPRARPEEPAIKRVASAAYAAFRGWAASGGVRMPRRPLGS